MKKVMFFLAIIIVCNLMMGGCIPHPEKSKGYEVQTALPDDARFVTLVWKPNLVKSDLDSEPLSRFAAVTFSITSLDDLRQNPRVIGKALEDIKIQGIFVPLATKISVEKWCKAGLLRSLHDVGITIDGKKGNCRLEVEILDVSIEDTINLTGRVSIRVSATTDRSLLIWEGKVDGKYDLYDRPAGSNGISECLSNTLFVTVYKLLTDQSFSDAVVKAFELE